MDIRCRKCGEPWDMDCVHEEVESRWPDKPWKKNGKHNQAVYERDYYHKVRAEFYRDGCKTFGGRCSTHQADERIGILYQMLGDDIDGAAAMLEDLATDLD